VRVGAYREFIYKLSEFLHNLDVRNTIREAVTVTSESLGNRQEVLQWACDRLYRLITCCIHLDGKILSYDL